MTGNTKDLKQDDLFQPEAKTSPPANTPFDPTELRLSQDFAEGLEVKKEIITVPVRRPNRQDFVRVHPSDDYRLATAVLELKEERETYLIAPALRAELVTELIPKMLITAINRQGVLTLWPIRLPGVDGRIDEWNASALEAADMARESWIRVVANMSLGSYEVFQANGDLPGPPWPDISFAKILEVAFKGRYITDLDHPVIRRLRGEL